MARFVQYWINIGPILGIFINKFPIFDQYWSNTCPMTCVRPPLFTELLPGDTSQGFL